MHDVADHLTPGEREAAEKWKAKHGTTCPRASYHVVSAVASFGYKLRICCDACGSREDITGPGRDAAPKK
jgi:hypothetical protein